jgi:hypothetical protein
MVIKFSAKDTKMECPAFIIYLVDSNSKRNQERFIREAYATKA